MLHRCSSTNSEVRGAQVWQTDGRTKPSRLPADLDCERLFVPCYLQRRHVCILLASMSNGEGQGSLFLVSRSRGSCGRDSSQLPNESAQEDISSASSN